MKARIACTTLAVAALACSLFAEEEAPRRTMKERLKARIAEDAKKTEPAKTAGPANASAAPAASAPAADTPAPDPEKAPTKAAKTPPGTTKSKAPKTANEPATVLPKVEVKKGRITELDQKLAKQEQDIAREKKNLKVSEVDSALNDSKVARPLSLFGGESSQFRQRVASERVELMEAEKDLIEAIAQAKTKDEKAALQKQLDELKAMRRELDKSLR